MMLASDERFLSQTDVLSIVTKSVRIAGTLGVMITVREVFFDKNAFAIEIGDISRAHYDILFAVMYLQFSSQGYVAKKVVNASGAKNDDRCYTCHVRPFNFSNYRLFRIAVAVFNYIMIFLLMGLIFIIGRRMVATF